jgi:tetratricopeptide (TPR) repeat protein
MASFQLEDRSKLRRHMVEQAIQLAMQSRWDEAVKINQTLLESFPNDVDSLNRLGRALTEMGQYADARQSYQRAVELDPNNTIAQKNLARLSTLNVEAETDAAREKVDLQLFIAETGKSGVTNLSRLADRTTIARMAVGDQVYLHADGRSLQVKNARGEVLGYVDPKIAQRLIDLMTGGNQYAAAIMSLDDPGVRVIIRETFQHPSQLGKVSFPSRGPDASAIRPYIKDSLLKYDVDDDDETEDGDGDGEAGEPEHDDATEPETFDDDRSPE